VIRAILVLAFAQAANDTVARNDLNRPAYNEAVDLCAQVEKILESSPEVALEKLAPVFLSIEKGSITLIEQVIYIYNRPQEGNRHEFYPYHLRGRAQLLAARKQKDEGARRLLIAAVADLRTSVDRKADRSREPLASAQKELWENARAALTYREGWKPEGLRLVDQALALIGDKEASDWLSAEAGRVESHLLGLRKTIPDLEARRAPAGHAADWCERVAASIKSATALKPSAAAIEKARLLAVAIRESKGTFHLKIGVSPYAKVERLERPGEAVVLADPHTPLLVPQELEIDTWTVELVHPKGRKNHTLPANSLEPGRTYVLWGDMTGGDLKVELLK
jgi:hypothetical protein